MTEEERNVHEMNPEHIPSAEEVHSVFRELIGQGREYKETKKREDEKGLYLLDVEVPGEGAGETIGYDYLRKGRYPERESSTTEIHVTYYENGVPVGGTSAAVFKDGKWKIFKP